MVLYKRKPVVYQTPPPLPSNLNIKIWHIPETGEWFYNYQDYLDRVDYYMSPKFVCEITGNSCFTFFEALASEKHEMHKVEEQFPEPLKEPVLRSLQFSTIPRLDLLVDMIYSQFKSDFYPGESVLVRFQDTKKYGRIKEKARFNPYVDEQGMLRPGYCTYRVLFDNNAEVTIDEATIFRDRQHFTKWIVKTFIKLTVSRSSKIGAPWIVREKFAKKYRIPMEYPSHLASFFEANQGKKKRSADDSNNENEDHTKTTKPTKSKASKKSNKSKDFKKMPLSELMNGTGDQNGRKPIKTEEDEVAAPHHNAYSGPPPPPAAISAIGGVAKNANLVNQAAYLDAMAPKKAIVNDLQIPYGLYFNADPESSAAKQYLKFQKPAGKLIPELQNCISQALSCWIFLNVYHNALILEPFTFDDFVCAMKHYEDGIALTDEIFCSVLSCVILGENEDVNMRIKGYEYNMEQAPEEETVEKEKKSNGKKVKDDDEDMETAEHEFPIPQGKDYDEDEYLLLNIPHRSSYFEEELKSEDEEEHEVKKEGEEEEEEEAKDVKESRKDKKKSKSKVKVKKEKTEKPSKPMKKDYGIKVNVYDIINQEEEEQDVEDFYDDDRNWAGRYLDYRNISWQERLHKRHFKDGNWQIVLIGVLSLASHLKKYRSTIVELNGLLAPKNLTVSSSTLQKQFGKLSLECKINALNIICELLIDGKIIRAYMDNALQETTRLRRDRLEIVREYKVVVEQARDLNSECGGVLQVWKKEKKDGSVIDVANEVEESHKKRRRNLVLRSEPTKEEVELAEANKDFKKLIDQRSEMMKQAETLRSAKKGVERKLQEMDCSRVRMLGKDNLYNQYWWFENSGLPMMSHAAAVADEDDEEEVKDIEEAHEDKYLMGRLWVQGPSVDDGASMLNIMEKDVEQFRKISSFVDEQEKTKRGNISLGTIVAANEVFDVDLEKEVISELSPRERKLIEEAPMPLLSASDWKYYDDSENVEKLIRSLNPWGLREAELRKQMGSLKAAMDSSMSVRRKHLHLDEKKEKEEDEEAEIKRCCEWKNTCAIERQGHNHLDGKKKKRK